MIFYPSEATILGLFILAAVVIFCAVIATLSYIDFGETTEYNVFKKLKANRLRRQLKVCAVIVLFAALAAGLQSSFIPTGDLMPDVEISDSE